MLHTGYHLVCVKVEESYWQLNHGYNRSNIDLQFLLGQGLDIAKALRAHGLAKEMQQESMQKVTLGPYRGGGTEGDF